MEQKQLLILNKKQINQKINRMAYQVLEDNLDEQELVIAGIAERGFTLAKRIKKVLEGISASKITLIRIVLDKDSTHLKADSDAAIGSTTNKVVILVDDVLNSGRTLAYGLGVFLDVPLKKLRILVLVDRSHRIFPVSADYTGLELATVLKEHVDVILNEKGEEDAVYLR